MPTKKPLIALVATAVLVNGKRQIVPPGQPLPELDAPDEKALLAAKAARVELEPTGADASAGEGTAAAANTGTTALAKGKK